MNETIAALLIFIAQYSTLPPITIEDVPPIKVVSKEVLQKTLCSDRPCPQLAAAFEYEKWMLYIRDDLDLKTPLGESFLLHELVHVVQFKAKGKSIYATCDDLWATEKEAYVLQDKWLAYTNQMFRAGGVLRFFSCS